ncbi:PAS domain S-box protein [Dehalobacter sp. DCM]|uniref:hybrid sensor histidine kinase/response regulator n=1 Tax=Dehalobacter sp. DCM TaxID=2907827 RepID=UPI0030820646|nr:PAS domain S-box protein [Dehalobacter sp. DCM]
MISTDSLSTNPELQRMLLNSNLLDMIPGGFSIATDATCKNIIHNPVTAEFLRIEPWSVYPHSTPSAPRLAIYQDGKLLSPEKMPIQRAAWYGEEIVGSELEFVWEDGISKIARWSAWPLLDADNHICGAISTMEEIKDLVHLTRKRDKQMNNLEYENCMIKRTQEALCVSEEKYRAFFDNCSDAVFITRPEGNIEAANHAACVMFQRTAEEIIALGAGGLVDLSDPRLPLFKEKRKKSLQIKAELNHIRKDGTIFPGEVSCTLFTDKYGVLKTSMIIRDLTDWKQKESQLAFQAKILSDVHEAVVAVNENYNIAYWNRMSDKLFNLRADEVLGKNFQDVFREIHPGFFGEKALTKLINSNLYHSEVVCTRDNGTKKHIEEHTSLIEGEDGEFKGIIATFRDISELKETFEELKNLKDNLTAEVEVLNIMHKLNSNFISIDNLEILYNQIMEEIVSLTHADKGCIQLFNEKERTLEIMQGYNLGSAFLEKFSSVDLENTVGGQIYKDNKRIIIENITNSRYEGSSELTFLIGEGIKSIQSTPLISSSGKFVGVLNTGYAIHKQFEEREIRMLDLLSRQAADAIERTRTEEALYHSEQRALALVEDLKKADKNKNLYINSLSHELRNPLASMMMSLSLLKIAAPDSEQAIHAKEVIERQTTQLKRLVDDLLDITRISQNKIQLKKEIIELNRVVARTAKDYKQMFAEKGVTLTIETGLEPIHIQADAARLTQAIGNLIHNSLKFTDPGEKTTVSVYKDEDNNKGVINVSDNGLGIKPEMLDDLFQPFVQADKSLEHSNGGLGLGLAIVKGIIDLHEGSIQALSEGLGKGAQFTIELPLIIDEKSNDIMRIESKQERYIGRRIVVIDDILDVAEILCALLRHLGHEVTSACTGFDGLSKIKEFQPDVVFCDIGLPGMNGYEVAKHIREDEYTKDVFLIALSGYAQAEDLERSREAGFNCHISKPVDLDTLYRVLSGGMGMETKHRVGA